ncbi:MAG: DNA repair protein RadC [Halieaceae bacterium]|nr:DNA repair protein RadC [Halieaceae bacterium]
MVTNCCSEDLSELTSAQLLAIQLNVENEGRQVAESLLDQCGGLARVLKSDSAWLRNTVGLSPRSIRRLRVVAELSSRAAKEALLDVNVLSNPNLVREYLSEYLLAAKREYFVCLYLDVRHQVLKVDTLFSGTVDSASVYPREIVATALQVGAVNIIIAHNHPSGCSQPSDADHRVTEKVRKALSLVDICLLDHLVLGQGEFFSFAKAGFL